MDEELKKRLAALEEKTDAIFKSVEQTRKYFLYTLIISVALVVLPAIGLLIAIPSMLSSYNSLESLDALNL